MKQTCILINLTAGESAAQKVTQHHCEPSEEENMKHLLGGLAAAAMLCATPVVAETTLRITLQLPLASHLGFQWFEEGC